MNCDQVWEILKRVEAVSHDLNNNIRNIRLGWVVQRLTGIRYEDMGNEYTGKMLEPSASNLTEAEKKQKYFWVKSEEVYPNEYEGGDPYFSHTYYSRFEVADRLLKIIGDVDMLTKSITEKETNK